MISVAVVFLSASLSLTPARAAVVSRVLGDGKPDCLSYLPDGSQAPCIPSLLVTPDQDVHGAAKGVEIEISAGAMNRLTEDEFALLVGHELAHWFLGHHESQPATEIAADRLGATLACRAGFNAHAGATLFRYFSGSTTYPEPKRRRRAVLQVPCPPVTITSNVRTTLNIAVTR